MYSGTLYFYVASDYSNFSRAPFIPNYTYMNINRNGRYTCLWYKISKKFIHIIYYTCKIIFGTLLIKWKIINDYKKVILFVSLYLYLSSELFPLYIFISFLRRNNYNTGHQFEICASLRV